jgi:hypothetical protein
MADETAFQVIRNAIFNANIDHPKTDVPGVLEQVYARNADHYARAVLIALEHHGYEIVRHTPEPPDDD